MPPLKPWPGEESYAYVSMRLADPRQTPIKGGDFRSCFNCNAVVTISPAGVRRMLGGGNWTIICIECAEAYHEANPQALRTVLPPNADQAAEIAEALQHTRRKQTP